MFLISQKTKDQLITKKDQRSIPLPSEIDAMAMLAVTTEHGFGMNMAQTTAMHTRVRIPVWNVEGPSV